MYIGSIAIAALSEQGLGSFTDRGPNDDHDCRLMPFRGMAEEFAALARELAKQPDLPSTLATICRHAVETIDGAEFAAITLGREGHGYRTVGATGDLPLDVDKIQYATQEGPCVDSLRAAVHHFRSDDVTNDPRWPVFGRLAGERTDVASMMSHRLYLEEGERLGALNIYSRKTGAFSDYSLSTLDMLATHAAIALAKAEAVDQSQNLRIALSRNRTIGVAIGIIMATYKTTLDQSFDLLRVSSQHSHRKLHDIALDVVETGALQIDP
jgi:GAF domain-containing protein